MKIKSLLFLLLFSVFAFGQRERIDSIFKNVKQFKDDTTGVKNYLKLGAAYRKVNPDSAILYMDKAIALSHKIKNDDFYGKSYYDKAIFVKNISTPKILIDSIKRIIEDPAIIRSRRYYQSLVNELGIAYRKIGNYEKSIKYLQMSVTLAEEFKDRKKLYNGYNSLANTYSQAGTNKKSIDDLKRALDLYTKAFDYVDKSKQDVVGMIINNQGVTNYYIGQLSKDSTAVSKAIAYYMQSLKIRLQGNDSVAIADSYDNIGSAYHDLCETYKKTQYMDICKAYYEKAMAIDEMMGKGITYYHSSNYAGHLSYMGRMTKDKSLIFKAIDLLKISLTQSDHVQDIFTSVIITQNIATSYREVMMPDSAVPYYVKHIALKDSILSAENKQVAEELAMKYESDLKDAENNNLKQQAELREEVISKKSNTIKLMIAASVIMLALIVMVFISRQNINRSRALIKLQQQETEKQKLLIEEKQKEILDSINYSKRLQDAAIPSIDYFKSLLPESFIYYKPKDIVAGDFYWIHKVKNSNSVLVAAADCTGHGVPGALVSIVCLNALNRCLDEFNLSDPSKILDKAAEIIQQSFRQSENDVKDGMDIALCLLDLENNKGHFSGANNPVWILRGKDVKEIKGDSQPVGQQHIPKPFTQHSFDLAKGDTILLSTDGYADQFGGPNGKKLKTKNFKDIFPELNAQDVTSVRTKIETFFLEWKGNHEQLDDVLVVGIRI